MWKLVTSQVGVRRPLGYDLEDSPHHCWVACVKMCPALRPEETPNGHPIKPKAYVPQNY